MKERIVLILAWVFSGRDNGNKGWKHSVANRAIAMGAVLCPNFLTDEAQSGLADVMNVSKQAAGELKRDARDFLLEFTGATMRAIPDHEPMVGADAPTDEHQDTATDCSLPEGACEATELEPDDDSAPDSCGDVAA